MMETPEPQDMDAAAADYRRAIQLAPAHAPSYEGLAGLIHGLPIFQATDIELLQRGLLLEPGNAMIEAGIAAAEIRSGRAPEGLDRLRAIVGRNAGRNHAGVQFARRVLAGELLKADLAEIERLADRREFKEAIAVIDRALERNLELPHRQMFAATRRSLVDYQSITAAVELAHRGDFSGSRAMLEKLLASRPDHGATAEAQRLLREIERQEKGHAKD
ncbi:MAG: hypothetical protein Q7S40_03350 [Opitutaceae bacterium]|nr:hypothetical protein [Opitutaceae bacterium]